jgi:TetR/AcrR family transcriptional regulator, regulator of cefoperazone and chloramphenicol sensitivity
MSEETPTGRPAAAPIATAGRGDTTREALIAAAIQVFGRDGFDAASTRAIAETAGVNQALIGYHFGGKPGLYLAALKFIADRVTRRMGPLVAAIETELAAEEAGATSLQARERALELFGTLTDAFVEMLTSDESSAWARLILREQQDPSDGFDVLYKNIMERLLDVATRLVTRARHQVTTPAEAKLTAVTIVGQALVFRAARTAVMRRMGWRQLGPSQIKSIQAELRRNVAAILAAENPR